jgi:hypothetical protein
MPNGSTALIQKHGIWHNPAPVLSAISPSLTQTLHEIFFLISAYYSLSDTSAI